MEPCWSDYKPQLLIKVYHIITGLDTGGAETMLYKLITRIDQGIFENTVISLTDIGPIGRKLTAVGIPVCSLGMRKGPTGLFRVGYLARRLRHDRPSVVQTWLYHADVAGGLAARAAGGIPVIWNVRQSNLEQAVNKRWTIVLAKLCARLSRRLPTRIVCCSESARTTHIDLGYEESKTVVISNGFDLKAYSADPEARASVRQELGLPVDALLIGRVGRFDPQKDHRNFIRAAEKITAERPDACFLLVGKGVAWENRELSSCIDDTGIRDRYHLLGRRDDIPRLTAAMDIAVSSSCGEGFPNVVGEAMACEVTCVVTDVGDSAYIVGETGRVVPAGDSEALAAACLNLLDMDDSGRKALGQAARARVAKLFNLPVVVKQYEQLYQEILEDVRRHRLF